MVAGRFLEAKLPQRGDDCLVSLFPSAMGISPLHQFRVEGFGSVYVTNAPKCSARSAGPQKVPGGETFCWRESCTSKLAFTCSVDKREKVSGSE